VLTKVRIKILIYIHNVQDKGPRIEAGGPTRLEATTTRREANEWCSWLVQTHYVENHFQGRPVNIRRGGFASRPYERVATNHVFVGAVDTVAAHTN